MSTQKIHLLWWPAAVGQSTNESGFDFVIILAGQEKKLFELGSTIPFMTTSLAFKPDRTSGQSTCRKALPAEGCRSEACADSGTFLAVFHVLRVFYTRCYLLVNIISNLWKCIDIHLISVLGGLLLLG